MTNWYALPLIGTLAFGGCFWNAKGNDDKYKTVDCGHSYVFKIEKNAVPLVEGAMWRKGLSLEELTVSSGTVVDPEKRGRELYLALTVVDTDPRDQIITEKEAMKYASEFDKKFQEEELKHDTNSMGEYLKNFRK